MNKKTLEQKRDYYARRIYLDMTDDDGLVSELLDAANYIKYASDLMKKHAEKGIAHATGSCAFQIATRLERLSHIVASSYVDTFANAKSFDALYALEEE